MPGPTIGRFLLGRRLAALRKDMGASTLDAAGAIGDPTDIRYRHYEAGRRAPKFETVIVLGLFFGLAGEDLAELQQMQRDASSRNRWTVFGLPENAATFLGLEDDAIEVRTVEHIIVPGILQTEAYMRRKFQLGADGLPPAVVNKRVKARKQRQERLTGEDPLRVSAVISESALLWCAHDPEVGVAQLEHLVDRGEQSNIEIRVLRFGVGLHPGMDGAFSLLRFQEGLLGDIAYVENVLGGHLDDEGPAVIVLDTLFGELRDLALGANESLEFIAQLADKTSKGEIT